MGADTSAAAGWFPALGEPRVRRYLFGQGASVMGSWVLDITLNLLVWQLTRSPATLGLLNFLIYGPAVLVIPLLSLRLHAGNARSISLAVLWSALAVALGLAAAAVLDALTLPLLLVAAALRGILGGLEVPSRLMLLTTIAADANRMGSAIAMNTVVFLLARTAGPGIAALMFEPLGPAWAFGLAALGLMAMLRCVIGLRGAGLGPGAPAPTRGLGPAWDFVRQDGFASLLLPLLTSVGLTAGAYQTLVPVLADRVFGDAARWIGWFFAAAGGGALVGAVLLSSRFMDVLLRRLLLLGPWLAVVGLVLIAASRLPSVSLLGFALLGFCMSFIATGTSATMHRRVPAAARGGLIALFQLAFMGVVPFAQLFGGALAQWLSVRWAFGLLAALLFLATLVLCARRWRRLGRLEFDASRL
ncbi:MFS transporter [Ramlibacter sp. AN1015]|uniref:MFS transporter n=1 Tax=Ramlibacter sp. AN1015 TaxID=3133428 RepID=UPI0030C2FA0C